MESRKALEFEGEHRYECIVLQRTHVFLFFLLHISYVNQSISPHRILFVFYPLYASLSFRNDGCILLFLSFARLLFSSHSLSLTFHLPSLFFFCKDIFADILSDGCLMCLCKELWGEMALRERGHGVISH
jgi:hypothetical protein